MSRTRCNATAMAVFAAAARPCRCANLSRLPSMAGTA